MEQLTRSVRPYDSPCVAQLLSCTRLRHRAQNLTDRINCHVRARAKDLQDDDDNGEPARHYVERKNDIYEKKKQFFIPPSDNYIVVIAIK